MSDYKKIFFLLTAISVAQFSFAQINQVKFEALDSLQKIEKRPVLIFLHTSWCKYCGTMKNSTLKNKEAVQLMNDKFYFVSLDIEERKDIDFRGHKFRYRPTGVGTGVHELAEQLGTINGAIGYPGICFLNTDYDIVFQKGGFIKATEFVSILKSIK